MTQTTLECSTCHATATAEVTDVKAWRGWRVLLESEERPPVGYVCPKCSKRKRTR